MSLKKDKPKSDGASSDVCIVDNDSTNTSGENACWKRTSPTHSLSNHSVNKNRNSSPAFTPSPSLSPSPVKPVSRLKRIILAPSQPNSPKRFNREIKIAIEKLRPINKYKFEEPTGNLPNTKFTSLGGTFTASNSSTPRKSSQSSAIKSQFNSTVPSTNLQILENIVLKKALSPTTQEKETHLRSNQQILNELNDQRLSLQQQLTQIEQQLQQKHPTPPLAQTQQQQNLPCSTSELKENNSQHTPPTTPPPKGASLLSNPTPPQKTPSMQLPPIAQQQETFAQQFQKHIANYKQSYTTPPPSGQIVSIPWATQLEKQQHKLEQLKNASALQLTNDGSTAKPEGKISQENPLNSNHVEPTPQKSTKQQIGIPSPKLQHREVSNKVPSVFIPHIASIERLTSMIDKSSNPISYSTTASQEGGVRIKCSDTDSYNNLLQLLQQQNVYLHTHQKPEDRGLRIVIRNLHASTSASTIRTLLADQGYEVKYVNVLKNRFTGIPLNMFEVEIGSKNRIQAEQILDITRLGNQEVSIERQARRTDPVQCHRCQAFGHSKNYCRRPFVCLKCAGNHPSYECKKDKVTKGLCANCKGDHIASYKGCPTFKKERTKLLAVRLINPIDRPITSLAAPQRPVEPLTQQQQQISDNEPVLQPKPPTLHQPQCETEHVLYQSPKPQRSRGRMTNANSPFPTKHMTQIEGNIRVPVNGAKNESTAKMTYSEAAREAINRPFSTPKRQNYPRQLQQQKFHQQPQTRQYNKFPPSQIPSKLGQRATSQIIQLGQNSSDHELNQVKDAIRSNAQNLSYLSEKIDKLYKLVNDHLTPILLQNQNKVNDPSINGKQ